jgi:hypothetical protein
MSQERVIADYEQRRVKLENVVAEYEKIRVQQRKENLALVE